LVNVIGHYFDAVRFWASLLIACSVIILAIVVHILYSLNPVRRRAKMDAVGRGLIRRDMDRMAEYIDGLPRSGPAVRQQFELGRAAMVACDWGRAIGHFREAMMQSRGAEIVALFNLTGVCQYTQGYLDKALADFEESARLAEQFQDATGMAPALGNIGVIWHDKGELDKALRYKEEAWEKAHGLGDQWAEALHLGNIGNIWRDRGDLDKALKYHEKALDLSQALGDKWGVASDLARIGSIYRDKGELDKALRYKEEALAMARKTGYRLGAVEDLSEIGSIYHSEGSLDKALLYGEKSLALARQTGYRVGVAALLGNIGLILKDKKEYAQAAPKLAEALTILLACGVADGPRQVLTGLIRCESKLGRKRVEELSKEAGLDDQSIADMFDRIDQMHRIRPGPKPKWYSRPRPARK
jgi:tetratricopeptide (TPR) repeat protein